MAVEDRAGVVVSRKIEVPAETLFAVLADPCRHPGLDGSGMLRYAVRPTPLSAVGDAFVLRMHNDEMGEYEMTNHVVAFEPHRRIAWEPVMSGASRPEDADAIGEAAGYAWGFELEAQGPGSTLVTEIYDCSRAPEWLRKVVKNGNRWADAMTATLERLDQQCATKLLTHPTGGAPATQPDP